jgi:cytosine/adenosine deaminase-related metal-dependent hydrolase
MSVVYCPRTHAYFHHAAYPLARMLDRGIHLALGTDSRASSPDLDMLEEMRYVARHHCAVAPDLVLRLGTLSAAKALGWEHEMSSIASGQGCANAKNWGSRSRETLGTFNRCSDFANSHTSDYPKIKL